MQTTTWVSAAVVIILIALGAWWFVSNNSAPAPQEQGSVATSTDQLTGTVVAPTGTTTTGTGATPAAGTFTSAQVATHASAASCWSIIDNNVYDLTAWIPQHPGGPQAIAQLCGKNGTALFHGQHGNAQQQATMLAKFKIGVLAQ